MQKLFSAFDPVSSKEWIDQIVKDLKGKELSILDFNDPIEDIDYRAYYHQDDQSINALSPGDFPSTRGSKTNSNNWFNGVYIPATNEAEANKKALKLLMSGADMLYFDDCGSNVNWEKVLEGIELEYIRAQFRISSANAVSTLLQRAGNAVSNIAFCFDALDQMNATVLENMRSTQTGAFVVNGYGTFHCGANTSQEIAFCLATGHDALVRLMEAGFSVDEAAAMIHFHVGIGSSYFNEIAKLRALRMLWSKVIEAYTPEHDCSYNCQITALIGLTNKSLKDRYTNLLRQTTEVMSAAHGADTIVVLPYDHFSTDGPSELASRMALNLSLILKEESYLHHVIDPVGGSYSIEHLTDLIARNTWSHFQKIEEMGGIQQEEALNWLKNEINAKRVLREERVAEGKTTLIGINKYPDPNAAEAQWTDVPGYLGMKPFIADLITQKETV